MRTQPVETTYNYEGDTISYSSQGITVNITTQPFQISYTYKGYSLISEKRGYYKSKHQPMDMVKGNIIADSTEKMQLT